MNKIKYFPNQISQKTFLVEATPIEVIEIFETVTKRKFTNRQLILVFRRYSFDHFAPVGNIQIQILDSEMNGHSIVKFTITGTSFPKYAIIILAFCLFLWTVISLLLLSGVFEIPTAIFAIIIFYIIIRFGIIHNLAKLENYSAYLLKQTKLRFKVHNN